MNAEIVLSPRGVLEMQCLCIFLVYVLVAVGGQTLFCTLPWEALLQFLKSFRVENGQGPKTRTMMAKTVPKEHARPGIEEQSTSHASAEASVWLS